MSIWNILGIEKTKDRDEIVNAYRNMLQFNNPEENQEGFMALRKAYEEALSYADSPDEDVFENLGEKLEEVYKNFRKRIDVRCWQEILSDDLFKGIDTKIEAENHLITFLMSNFRLPANILSYIAKELHWEERRRELSDNFYESFFDYIFDVIDNGEYYKMDYFDGADYAEYDLFIEGCMSFALGINNNTATDEQLESMDAFEIYHPYFEILKADYYLKKNDIAKVDEITQNFKNDYPDDLKILSSRLKYLTYTEQVDDELASRVFELDDKSREYHLYEIIKMAKSDISEAKEKFYQFIKSFDHREDEEYVVKILNKYYIPYLESKDELKVSDNLDIAWSLYEESDYEESYKKLCEINVDDLESILLKARYYKLRGFICSILSKDEESVGYIEKWLELKEEYGYLVDNTKKVYYELNQESKNRNENYEISAMLRALVISYNNLNNGEKALFFAKKFIDIDDKSIDNLLFFNRICLRFGKYEDLMNRNVEMMRENGEDERLLYFCVIALFHLGEYHTAMRYINMAYDISPDIPWFYHYELMILSEWNMGAEFSDLFDKVKNIETNDIRLELYDILVDKLDGNYDIALEKIQSLNEKAKEQEDEALVLQETSRIYTCKEDFTKALEYIEKSIEIFPNDVISEFEKGYLLVMNNKLEEAIEYYHKLIESRGDNPVYYVRIASAKKRKGDFEGSIESYKKAIEIDPEDDTIYGYISEAFEDFGNKEEALSYRKKATAMNPSYDNLMNLSILLHNSGADEEAVENLTKALELEEANSDAYTLLALSNAKLGKITDMEENYKTAIDIFSPNFYYFNTFFYKIVYHIRNAEHKKIVEVFEEYSHKYPELFDDIWLKYRYPEALYTLGEYEKAEEVYSMLMEQDTDDDYNSKIEYAQYLGATKEDKNVGLEYIKKYENSKRVQDYIGFYNYMILGNYKEAVKYYEKSNDCEYESLTDYFDHINQYEAMWYMLRSKNGVLNEGLKPNNGFFDKSKMKKVENFFIEIASIIETYYKEYGEYPFKDIRGHSLAAEAYFYKGDYEKAEMFANMSLNMKASDFDLVNDTPDTLYVLGMINELRGNYEKAFEYYQEIIKEKAHFHIFKEAYDRMKNKLNK